MNLFSLVLCPSPILAVSLVIAYRPNQIPPKLSNKMKMKALSFYVESTIFSPIVLNIGMSTVLTKLSDWSLFT